MLGIKGKGTTINGNLTKNMDHEKKKNSKKTSMGGQGNKPKEKRKSFGDIKKEKTAVTAKSGEKSNLFSTAKAEAIANIHTTTFDGNEHAVIKKDDHEILTVINIGYKIFALHANLLDAPPDTAIYGILNYDVTRATRLEAWLNNVDHSKTPIM
eukprot:Ihof_evm3s800 gene=Ihof_evmTU3s800